MNKMHWGHKITIVIVVFLIGMTGMVFVASRQTNEMIDEKYYEKELVYQDLINAKENLQMLKKSSLVQQNEQQVMIQIPPASLNNIENGVINFLKNEDKSKDLQTQLKKGWYKFRIRWKSEGKEYFSEENLQII
jgi:hypothetical protein